MSDWVKKGREIAEYIKQLETERDNWMQWCKSAELQAIYLRGKLDVIRQEADIRQEEPEFKPQTNKQLRENMSRIAGRHTAWKGEGE